ncbi:uncharacterized protein LOC127708390 [Mytilus californianus]|uniref:uncharacterized protein LOC127708390 n=1 Tax=Mytilus californianus TaxID=6549 RepID=UPI002247461B|nr:uncharacterized protein LOC127708390 [Mytilus californianus]XP_052069227.1 uncharacterized protein LOC127708390 [Mytilus californianus]XP_052069228.1 uncharacterized protein LOC127708390 [Mytilus californianus]XP_052069229.1 uncharacterized protein LOC127708390 [Mytilus californianus]XP_052069230.1 uncharacterized protein LOC127708390 [Mytilus californianus]XP_052069231.1 uncharacterized protein LOC127708390 [Mytilus californianus]
MNGMLVNMTANTSNLGGDFFMFKNFSNYIHLISVANGILSLSGFILNAVLLFRVPYSPWKVLVQILCLVNGLGALSLNAILMFLTFKDSTDGYYTEVYLLSWKINRHCSLFLFMLEIQEMLSLTSLQLCACISITMAVSIFHVRHYFQLTTRKSLVLCGLMFLVMCAINIHKFSSIRINSTFYEFNSLRYFQCRARHEIPVLMAKYFHLYYHVFVKLILPMSLWGIIFLFMVLIMYKLFWMKSFNSGKVRNSTCYKWISLILIICALCGISSLYMQGLHFLGNKAEFQSNIHIDQTVSVFRELKMQYTFCTSITEQLKTENYEKNSILFFTTETTQSFVQFMSYMFTSIFYTLLCIISVN